MVPFVIILFTILFERIYPDTDSVTNFCWIAGLVWIAGYIIVKFVYDAKVALMYEDYLEVIENMLEKRTMEEKK